MKRLLKKVFNWSKSYRKGWENRVLKMGESLNVLNVVNSASWSIKRIMTKVKETLVLKDSEKWFEDLQNSDKLRTYRKYKSELTPEKYCILPLPRDHRRILFKLRSCSLPLYVETGRYSKPKVPLENRLCKLCNNQFVEDETHFVLNCDLYSDIREILFSKACEVDANFTLMHSEDKLIFLMQSKDIQFSLGTSVSKMFNRRKMFI